MDLDLPSLCSSSSSNPPDLWEKPDSRPVRGKIMLTLASLMNDEKKVGLVVLIIAALLPLVIRNSYILHLIILIMVWTVLGASWNLLGGYTGQVSFGHAAFF